MQLIQQVSKGMQVAARPPDPETAPKGQGVRSLRIIPKSKSTKEEGLSHDQLKLVNIINEKMRRGFERNKINVPGDRARGLYKRK